jgi:uncharacterized protein YndB with AHSA1/START domain
MNSSQTKPNSVGDRVMIHTRDFDASPDLVFDAWTHPDKIGQWWGPNGFTTTTHGMDFRPGGSWSFIMHGPDGTDYVNRIAYTEINRPRYLKYDHYGHEDGDDDPPHFRVTVTFEDIGGKTRLTMRMLFPTAEARDRAARFGAVEGGKQTLQRLAGYLANTTK